MNSKSEWLTKFEEDCAKTQLLRDQSAELMACQRTILDAGAPRLWKRLRDCLYETLATCEMVVSQFDASHLDHAIMRIFKKDSDTPAAVMDVEFIPETHEIKSSMHIAISGYQPKSFRFVVSGGRVSLCQGTELLPDNGEDVAEVACQRILEPLLKCVVRGH